MTAIRCSLLGCALTLSALLLTSPAEGQVRVQPGQVQPLQFPGRTGGPIVAADLLTKLNLTADQKDKLEKVEKEYGEKAKENETKLKEAREAAAGGNAEARTKIREATQAAQKTRTDYTDKVKALFTEEQKKTFEEAQARRPGIVANPFARADLNTKATQEKLGLSPEQVEKLEKLKKDFEAKTLEVLSKEQQEKFAELKKARPSIRPINPNP